MLVFSYYWVLTLLPLPWLLRAVLPARQRSRVSLRVPFGDRLAEALRSEGATAPIAKRSRGVVPVLVWLLVLVALGRPQWIEPPVTREIPTRDILLLIDLSGSMEQEDFTNAAGEQVQRLTAVKEVVGDFLERRQGDRVGLVVFGDAPYLQAPFSTDLELSRRLLDECSVGMAGPRTALGDAIGLAINLFDESDAPAKTIIALTDGNDTKSRVPPVEAARVATDRDITIHTVAIGDPTTVGEDQLDEQALRDVAAATGGTYAFAADRENLQGIYDELDRIETHEVDTVSHRPRLDLFYVPLLIALGLSLAEKAYQTLHSRGAASSGDRRRSIRVDPVTGRLELEA
jgi:Ca-activated chloride channel family protein